MRSANTFLHFASGHRGSSQHIGVQGGGPAGQVAGGAGGGGRTGAAQHAGHPAVRAVAAAEPVRQGPHRAGTTLQQWRA